MAKYVYTLIEEIWVPETLGIYTDRRRAVAAWNKVKAIYLKRWKKQLDNLGRFPKKEIKEYIESIEQAQSGEKFKAAHNHTVYVKKEQLNPIKAFIRK